MSARLLLQSLQFSLKTPNPILRKQLWLHSTKSQKSSYDRQKTFIVHLPDGRPLGKEITVNRNQSFDMPI